MKQPQEFQKESEERQGWLTCDPTTLVAAARSGIHEIPESQRSQIAGPLEEIVARYEHQARAALGASVAAPAGAR